MPAQPPFLTPTRNPATGRSTFAIKSLMRVAAVSLSRITCSFGLAVAIASLFSPSLTHHMWSRSAHSATPSPHVERHARFVGHSALVPRRIPDDVHGNFADAGHARHRILDHRRQLGR